MLLLRENMDERAYIAQIISSKLLPAGFNSPRRAENYRTFEDPTKWSSQTLQWENKKAVKRTQKVALPVVR